MGLYLCVFDESEEEIDGVEVGSYEDYGHFIDMIIQELEDKKIGSRYPLLTQHSDSDGEWSSDQCYTLAMNLREITQELKRRPPSSLNLRGR
jgi:hypothetical protein